MEYVFLDTSIFLKENFMEGKRLKELFKLSEQRKIRIVLTRITIGEIISNYRTSIITAIEKHNAFKKPFESRTLRNYSGGPPLFPKLKWEEILEEFEVEFEELLRRSRVLVIGYSPMNIETVFEKYFNRDFPFSSGDKKSEFPDAFALALLENWCIGKGRNCRVFSRDTDFLKYKSKHLIISEDYETYLDTKLKRLKAEKERIELLETIFEESGEKIDAEIEDWYREALLDEMLYYHFVWMEIHDIQVKDVIVVGKTFEIVSMDDEYIDIEIEAEVEFSVVLTIDDESSSIYDSEDKVTHYFDTASEWIQRTTIAMVSASIYIAEDSYEKEFTLDEINKDYPLEVAASSPYRR
jgi:predicted nucleic acid-binding protein